MVFHDFGRWAVLARLVHLHCVGTLQPRYLCFLGALLNVATLQDAVGLERSILIDRSSRLGLESGAESPWERLPRDDMGWRRGRLHLYLCHGGGTGSGQQSLLWSATVLGLRRVVV